MPDTILVIEDDEAILQNTVEILKLYGFNALSAANGTAGLESARQYRPDLILCDVMMPDLSGHEVLAYLRRDPVTAATPFIYMTAQSQRNQIRQGMELGADDYLTKPFSSDELITAVKTRLYRYAEIVDETQQRLHNLTGNIIYMLPHELRTPLNHILGYAEILLASEGDLPQAEMMDMFKTIQRGGLRLLRLIENCLLYAQLQILRSDPAKMATICQANVFDVKDSIEMVALACAEKVRRTADLSLNVVDVEALQFAPDSLTKVISELIDNAFKFSTAGNNVSITTSIDENRYVVEIVDHGRGMNPQELSNIGPFMQFQRSVYEQQGSGMGLIIVRSLVELYGSTLACESIPDIGTTIRIGFKVVASA